MDNQELLQSIRQIVREETENVIEEKTSPLIKRLDAMENSVSGVKVLLDTEIRRNIMTIAERHQVILDRLPDADEMEAMEARLSAVEVVVRKHSKDIQNLKRAQ